MSNPILIDFPDQIETERLILRSTKPGDGKALRQSVLESQSHLKDWMAWAVDIPDEEGYEKMERENHVAYLSRTNLMLVMISKENGKMIGGTGYHNLDWDIPSFEIGYWLNPHYTGRGYVTEAVKALTDFAFDTLQAKRVEIRCDANNEKSVAVAERAGYTLDGTLKHNRRHHLTKELSSTKIFSKVKG